MIEIITTSDGSHSLRDTERQETYHSIHGAIQESQYVFIGKGLSVITGKHIRILEVGFGTGLNALLTLKYSHEHNLRIDYESWELHPLEPAIIDQLNYGEILNAQVPYRKMHEAAWNEWDQVSSTFHLFKHRGNLVTDSLRPDALFDLIYYDAFAPARQPEMWTIEILRKVTDHLREGGVWVTYCAKGQVKRDLKMLGLAVETLEGPPGKKEMIRATKSKS